MLTFTETHRRIRSRSTPLRGYTSSAPFGGTFSSRRRLFLRTLQSVPNILTHAIEVAVHVRIGITKHSQPQGLQVRIPLSIRPLSLYLKMLRSIQFNNELGFRNIEVHNIFSNHLLPMHSSRQCFQKIIPQMPFLFGHVFAKCFGVSCQLFILCFIHTMSYTQSQNIPDSTNTKHNERQNKSITPRTIFSPPNRCLTCCHNCDQNATNYRRMKMKCQYFTLLQKPYTPNDRKRGKSTPGRHLKYLFVWEHCVPPLFPFFA